jgi:chloramphenicol-sensitive protein RarD
MLAASRNHGGSSRETRKNVHTKGARPLSTQPLDRRGLIAALIAFCIWGLMPLYWHLLKAVPSLQIIAHRIVWSTLMVVGWLLWRYGRGWLRETLQQPRAIWMLALSGTLIAVNWGLYIWAVNAGHVVETSLGYFINPLLNVVLGVGLLGERLNRAQWLSVLIAACGVLWLTFNYGNFPWIALALAFSFGMYGLVRKIVAVPPVRGLGVESLYLFLPVLGFLLWSETQGRGGFLTAVDAGGWGAWAGLLLILGGALTAAPLIAFADAVRRIPFSLVGLIQYIAPTLQLICGVLILGEPFGRERMIGFVLIWLALAIFAIDGMLRSRRRPVERPT